ncbi:hypothetical protein [Frankia tisae]|uniref:hypothetical protein n=1 Tax=Frankia tisae TaxID=2950104 RepID=UPI0021BE51F9|nr:hypothetical protein [Frankia tisae]
MTPKRIRGEDHEPAHRPAGVPRTATPEAGERPLAIRPHRAATWPAVVVTAALAFAAGCGLLPPDERPQDERPPHPRRCAVVVDVSASVPPELHDRYRQDADAAVTACAGGVVHVDVADANARAGTCAPVERRLSAPKPRDNEVFDGQAEQEQVDAAKEQTAALLGCGLREPAQATDLFGAIVLAGTWLHEQEADGHDLTVISDGISTADPFDLSARELDDGGITALLAELGSAGGVADLGGVNVRFVGVGVGVEELGPARLGRVDAFWRAYVDHTGGSVSRIAKTLGGA